MKNILVAGKLHPLGHAILDAQEDFHVRYIEEVSEPSYAAYIEEADALLLRTQPMTAATIAKADKLKLVSRHGVGFEAVDIAALNAKGILLSICGDVNSYSVAEHTMMMILGACKRAVIADRAVREDNWTWRQGLQSQDLRGRNVLQLGYGRIGHHVVHMLRGFGVNIQAYDPFLLSKGWGDPDTQPAEDLHAALAWADVVSVSVPYSGKPLLGLEELAALKDGAIVVNTARGGVVCEDALEKALQSGKVAAAGLDVFLDEPPSQRNRFADYPQVILSPHIAGVTEGAAERMAVGAAENIVAFFKGELDSAFMVNEAAVAAA